MIPDEFVTDTFIAAKFLILVFLALYILFAIVLIRQVRLMTETLDVNFDDFLRLISYVHLFFAGSVFLIALFNL